MSKGNTSKTLVWILMAMLIFGLGGFGVTNLGGSVQSVGDVNGKEIDINEYARAVQNELNALSAQTGQTISFQTAQTLGLDRVVLGRLVVERAMDAETDRMGLSIGDENLRDELLEIPAFQSIDGSFDREAYRFAMQQAGMSESQFEDSIREDTVRTLLQGAVAAGVVMPSTYSDTLLNWAGEMRDFTWARLDETTLAAPVATPTEDELRAHYDANIDSYMQPATRQITYALLTPDMILDEVEIAEDALMAAYELRADEFNTPERRLVERLAFADQAAADDARGRLDRGEVSFEGLVEERGLALADVDMGDVSRVDLGDAAEAVFAAAGNEIVGPVNSDLGPALFRINGILAAQTTTFEEARDDIREELAADKARREIDARIGPVDDLLAAGATLEELAEEEGLEIGKIDWHPASEDAIAGYEAFRAAAEQVAEGDFPEVATLEDGGIFALRLDGTTEAAPIPFDEVRDQVAEDMTRIRTVEALNAVADNLVTQLGTEADFAAFGLTAVEETGLMRSDFIPAVPPSLVEAAFEMAPGETRSLASEDAVFVIRLDGISPADLDDPENAALRASVDEQVGAGLSQDIFEAFAQSLQAMSDINLNQQALNAVHAQFQ
ncbi:peptidyl-prolyl cis-trans isomerase [Shimia biformata]|uniref:peptidyl-prolyl cis-trans isomerase n=1 Tax=Shimia biformata TaxID=1294299 RepID=UPI001951D63B|nr:peptidyl-prolyl cis-trans isomerase [Shimia biformata]